MRFALATLPLICALAACATTPAAAPAAGAPACHTDGTAAPPADDGLAARPAADFTLTDTEGRTVRLSDYRGQVVLLDFWATWCVPCEAALPHLERIHQAHKDAGLVVLGISMDGPETISTVGPFARRHGLTFPVLLDEETRAVAVYNPRRSAPLQILIDRAGKVAKVHHGYVPGDEVALEEEIRALLKP